MKLGKSYRVREATEQLYADLTAAGIEVLLDDRDVRPGFMFADMELIGIPHRVVVGDKGAGRRHGRVQGPHATREMQLGPARARSSGFLLRTRCGQPAMTAASASCQPPPPAQAGTRRPR